MFKRRFNTAGPCIEGRHYMIEPIGRLPEARGLVEQGAYFVVHAPRQTGKTTTLMALAKKLTADGQLAALYFNGEAAQALGERVGAVEKVVWESIRQHAADALPPDLQPPADPEDAPESLWLTAQLKAWCRTCPRPVVLFFDEIDSLQGESLRSILRQFRSGFASRFENFPRSIILCGLRDVRDYKAASGGDPSRLGTSSPFNIKLESLRIGDFDEVEVNTLLDEHTADTGQVFTPEARTRLFALSQGQPWLTNALAREVVEKMAVTGPIEAEHIDRAKERLILARATHLDSLVARLNEPRVRRVLEPLIAGTLLGYELSLDDDLAYLRDIGLIARNLPVRMANPIYREVVVRVLATQAEANITVPRQQFVTPAGHLDLDRLLRDFLTFWKRHGEAMGKRETYHEVAAQLVLMAWLQRVVNGGGYVEREYAIGKGAIDLCLRWPLKDGTWQVEGFELKTRGPHDGDPLEEGLEQLDAYLDQLGLPTGTLALFDRRPDAPPLAQRSSLGEAVTLSGRTVRLLRG
jgi:hypothetical protein